MRNTRYLRNAESIASCRDESSETNERNRPAFRRIITTVACLGIAIFASSFSVSTLSSRVAGRDLTPADASGAELFETNCARCHGVDGKGGKGPNLASEKKQAKWKESDAKLIKKITNGGFVMPSFGKKLKPEEIKAIADHVRTLKE